MLGHWVKRILGLSSYGWSHLFQVFQQRITRLENTVRWRWAVGDAVWDGHATQRHAVNDFDDQHPVVRRVTVAGDAPVGVDGRRSVLKSQRSRTARAG